MPTSCLLDYRADSLMISLVFVCLALLLPALEVLKVMARDPRVADYILHNDGVRAVVKAMSQWSRSAEVIKTV